MNSGNQHAVKYVKRNFRFRRYPFKFILPGNAFLTLRLVLGPSFHKNMIILELFVVAFLSR